MNVYKQQPPYKTSFHGNGGELDASQRAAPCVTSIHSKNKARKLTGSKADGWTNGQTDTTDRFTLPANAAVEKMTALSSNSCIVERNGRAEKQAVQSFNCVVPRQRPVWCRFLTERKAVAVSGHEI